MEIISKLCILLGVCFMIIASIGVIRFPDFFSRCHPAGKADTLGQSLVIIGLILYQGLDMISLKLLFVLIFIWIVNPTATHAIVRAAYLSGVKPWEKEKNDN